MRPLPLLASQAPLELRIRTFLGQFTESRWLARFIWLLPVGVAYFVRGNAPYQIQLFLGAILAGTIVVFVSRFPVWCLIGVIAFLPFKDFVFAWLYKFGVPGDLLRPAAAWREILVVAAALGAYRQARGRGHRFDTVDRLALGLIAIGLLYLVFPIAGAQQVMSQRLVGLRVNVGFPLVFLSARHLMADERQRTLVLRAVVITGVIAAMSGLIQYLDPDWWRDFVLRTVQLPRFLFEVSKAPFNGNVAFDETRPGGITRFGPLLANLLVLPTVIAAHHIARERLSAWWMAAAGIMTVAIITTSSRGAALATAIGIGLAFRRGGNSERRPCAIRPRRCGGDRDRDAVPPQHDAGGPHTRRGNGGAVDAEPPEPAGREHRAALQIPARARARHWRIVAAVPREPDARERERVLPGRQRDRRDPDVPPHRDDGLGPPRQARPTR